MSSDLLQQAMIDAQALKEAAMKNAENALIEKYSQEFNQVVQRLLEQEDVAAAAPPVADPSIPADPAAVDPAMADPMADPMAGMDADLSSPEQEKAFAKVPGAFDGGDEEEMITINFDQLKTTLNEMLGIKIVNNANESNDGGGEQEQPATGDALDVGKEGNPVITVKLSGLKNDIVDLDGDEEFELELEEDGMGGSDEIELEEQDVASQTSPAIAQQQAAVGKAKSTAAAEEGELATIQAQEAQKQLARQKAELAAQTSTMGTMEEDLELSEDELQELEEELKVDLDVGNLSDGYMGSTSTQKREQRAVELAASRDDEAVAEREAELEKMADLMKENKELKKLNDETYKAAISLKEQLKKTNLLNAKLLYTNKALANVSLNERQKQNIVESISKADSVLAAKTIYETAQNAVGNVDKTKEAPQSLREAINRSATPFVVKKTVNSDPMAERLKTLAGINKKQ